MPAKEVVEEQYSFNLHKYCSTETLNKAQNATYGSAFVSVGAVLQLCKGKD